jgi:hypothetical protein
MKGRLSTAIHSLGHDDRNARYPPLESRYTRYSLPSTGPAGWRISLSPRRVSAGTNDAIKTRFAAGFAKTCRLRHHCGGMAKLQPTFKLRVKLAAHEFEAEGTPDLVTGHFETFPTLVIRMEVAANEGTVDREGLWSAAPPRRPRSAKPKETPHVPPFIRVDQQTNALSLRMLPSGGNPPADAALLLLLGHQQIHGKDDIPVTDLTEALKQSGCPVRRLDRALSIHLRDHSVVKSGRGKGGRYRLTNLGIKKAHLIATQLDLTQPNQ